MLDENDVRERVRTLVAEMAPVKQAQVTPDSDLGVDLGYDSLRLMELATLLEDRFGIAEITEDDAAEADTVGDIEDLICRLLDEDRAA